MNIPNWLESCELNSVGAKNITNSYRNFKHLIQ